MGKSSPTPPPAPDPTVVAQAQSTANIASATAQQKLNMINTSGPSGSVNYTADPNAPGGYSQTTTLSPSQQAIYDQGTQAQSGALGIANTQLGRVNTALGQTLNPGGLQTSVANPNVQSSVGLQGSVGNPSVQTSYDQGGPIQQQVNTPDFSTAMQNASNAVYGQATSRLDPQWQQAQSAQNAQLANQGLGANSTAFQNQQGIFDRAKNDAYNQADMSAIQAGQAVQAQGYGQALSSGQFANAAQGQQNTENAAQAQFANSAAGQQFGQNLQAGQFGNDAALAGGQFANSAAGQQFGQNVQAGQFGNQALGQQFSQTATAQEQPINEFNSLMSSSQIAPPQGVQYTPSSVGQTDVTGAYALNSQVANQQYQAQMANQSSLMGGLAKLGGSAMMAFSDVRLKEDVRRVGALASGLPVYSYRFKGRPERMIGVMAHEARLTHPHAVYEHPSGFLMVDYGALS